jgi:hypothetical protein
MSPIKVDGQENAPAIAAARSQGGIQAVKDLYNQIHGLANDNSKTEAERATAIRQCYGLTIAEVPSNVDPDMQNLVSCIPQTFLATLPASSINRSIEVKDNWIWSFTVKPTGTVSSGWSSIFVVNQGGVLNFNNGARMPALYFQPGTTNLFVSIVGQNNQLCEISNIELPLNKNTNIIISYGDGELIVKTSTEGVENKFSRSCPGCPKGVATFYGPSPWNPRFVGEVTNLSFCTYDSNTVSVLDYKPGRTKTSQRNFEPVESLFRLRAANVLAPYGQGPWGTGWAGYNFPLNQGIQWIWNTPTAAGGANGNPVQFYKFWTNNTDSNIIATLVVSADNTAKIYVNDNFIGENRNTNTGTYQITLSPGENKIHIEAKNAAGWPTDPAGLAVYCFTGNRTLFVSNDSWLRS